ncbi:MAG TPA: hypothetical protein VFS21_36980 [Roseiflexaceae bacterium]|nr:hypothetical protein [Roseiflexaceae bacterium]
MLSIRSIVGTDTQWTPDSDHRREYTLVSNGQKVATLRFPARGLRATAESADGCWTLERTGTWEPQVALHSCGGETPVGTFICTARNTHGTLRLDGGRRFLFSTNIWKTRMAFSDRSNTKLVTFKLTGWVNIGARVEVTPAGAEVPELPLLTLLGWYQVTMVHLLKHLIAAFADPVD